MKKAVIMDIQRYSIHDGPGIRTTVFFKGCHMSCKWCHNPESHRPEAEMLFYGEQCIHCGSCFAFCKRGAHRMDSGVHRVDLAVCQGCPDMGACSGTCPAQALRVCGQEMSVGELLEKVMADRDFYGEEGGVTCSGGEALLWSGFLLEFLPLCRENGISVCLDTSLNVEWERIEALLPFTDLLLVDVKFMDPENHRRFSGTDGHLTVENLRRLSESGKPVILRMPLLFGINDTEWEAAERKKLLGELGNVQRVDCFAVTGHGAAKYRALQREFVPFNRGIDPEELAAEMKKKMR